MYYFLLIILVVIAAALTYLGMLEGAYEVRRSKRVNADRQTVYDKLRDFKSWADWSPWLIHEPETELVFSDNYTEIGGSYAWNGIHVGAGKLTHIKFDAPSRIEQRLEFTRPFKSICDVSFELADIDGQTELSWIMRGKMPFLFRFMTKKTTEMIGYDYDLGLAMLAGQIDSHSEHPVLSFDGVQARPERSVLCKSFSGGVEAMQATMRVELPALLAYIEKNNGTIADAPLTVYNKVDLRTMHFDCDIAIPVEDCIESGDYQLKKLPHGQFYKVTLNGSYDFLEIAWNAAHAHIRMHKLKYAKRRPSLEVYTTDPASVDSTNQLRTELYIPLST